jgi:hypothetical protein
MTPRQAAFYADQLLRSTAAALAPRPRLEFSEEFSDDAARCPGGPDAGQMVVVSRCYWLRGLTGDDYAATGAQVLARWRFLGWVITDVTGQGTTRPVVGAVAPPYAFRVSLEWSDTGGSGLLSLNAASVCLWPDGSPERTDLAP